MSWYTRLQRKMELRSDAQHNVDSAIEINALNIEDVSAMKHMMATDGWKMFEAQIRKDLASKQKTIEDLSIDPENKKFELAYYGAACALIRRQLAFVSGVVGKEAALLSEQRRLSGLPTN